MIKIFETLCSATSTLGKWAGVAILSYIFYMALWITIPLYAIYTIGRLLAPVVGA